MEISVKACPSESTERTFKIDIERDLSISLIMWNAFDDEQKREIIQAYLDDVPDQPYWAFDGYTSKF